MRALVVLVLSLVGPACMADDPPQRRPNVVLLISDDMRDDLGCSGGAAPTPHLDRLASMGVRFSRAYCQFPLCNPSRASMLTGRYPGAVVGGGTGVLGNRDWFRQTAPDAVSLTQHFQRHGYVTLRAGKVFHGGLDDTEHWSEGGEPRYFGPNPAATPPDEGARERRRGRPSLSKTERSDRWIVVPGRGERHGDTRAVGRAVAFLDRYAGGDAPFFLAVGVAKPHSPLEAPQECYDRVADESVALPVDFAPRPTLPPGFPRGSVRRENADLFVGRDATPEAARDMRRAYFASMAFADSNLGRVLDALDRLDLWGDTVVVFWSDHGYQLGEKGKWSKAGSLWERGARVPLIVRPPGGPRAGAVCRRVVESVDLFPTLCDLCRLPTPAGVQGRSLAPLLAEPAAPWGHPAFTVWSEGGRRLTGVAVRVAGWRYAEFEDGGAMLLDQRRDPHELVNLADDPAHADTRARLAGLVAGYRERFGPHAAPAAAE